MKPEIHPEMVECVITCVCGATHKTLAIQSNNASGYLWEMSSILHRAASSYY